MKGTWSRYKNRKLLAPNKDFNERMEMKDKDYQLTKALKDARKFFDDGNYSEGKRVFRKAQNIDPENKLNRTAEIDQLSKDADAKMKREEMKIKQEEMRRKQMEIQSIIGTSLGGELMGNASTYLSHMKAVFERYKLDISSETDKAGMILVANLTDNKTTLSDIRDFKMCINICMTMVEVLNKENETYTLSQRRAIMSKCEPVLVKYLKNIVNFLTEKKSFLSPVVKDRLEEKIGKILPMMNDIKSTEQDSVDLDFEAVDSSLKSGNKGDSSEFMLSDGTTTYMEGFVEDNGDVLDGGGKRRKKSKRKKSKRKKSKRKKSKRKKSKRKKSKRKKSKRKKSKRKI